MSESKAFAKSNGDEGLLATIIPMLFTIAVSVATFLVMDSFKESNDPKVLVYSIADWVPFEEGRQLDQDEIASHLEDGRLAAKRAAEAGYIVIPAKNAMEIPGAARLKPGMFDLAKEVE